VTTKESRIHLWSIPFHFLVLVKNFVSSLSFFGFMFLICLFDLWGDGVTMAKNGLGFSSCEF